MTDPDRFKTALLAELQSLRAFAISITGNVERADDLVQDTLVKAWSNMHGYTEGTNIRAWLFTILRNTFYSDFRKRSREVEDDGAYAARLSVHAPQHGHMDLADFRKALATLPDDQREALILVGASGFSYEEAAEICGCALGTIKSRINRARARLADMLAVSSGADFGPDADSCAAMPDVAGGRRD
ncbi:sigma-70 family RNA polymerase sigma factor [Camelimonas abortus]|uniref:RNA polymerase sigma factor n=1 Tax=Camelimonas abortus TaxID=1017184 RepID=A0ABV7LBG8_9HYPH